MLSAVTTFTSVDGWPSARPPSVPTPLKSASFTILPAVGGGMSGGVMVGASSVWNPRGTAATACTTSRRISCVAGGGGGGGASLGVSSENWIRFTASLTALRVTGKDVPMPYAANLEKLALPSVAEVVEAAKAVADRQEQLLKQAEEVRRALEEMRHEVTIDPAVAERARQAVERMLVGHREWPPATTTGRSRPRWSVGAEPQRTVRVPCMFGGSFVHSKV